MALLVDTHIWYWFALGDEKSLGRQASSYLKTVSMQDTLLVSAISAWEIAMLHRYGRIKLELPTTAWVGQALALPGIKLAAFTPEIAVESCNLPGTFHNDPADRLLVATARMNNVPIMTFDKLILAYGKKGFVRTTGKH